MLDKKKIYCIKTSSNDWYCKTCEKAHNRLFIKGDVHYCPTCVPVQVSSAAVTVNQNMEEITV